MAKINISLIKQALLTRQANARQSTSHVKSRGEVSGGGRKPWRQKGTGRARAGSNRSPIWVGGGVTFGPRKNRTFKSNLPKKMNIKALAELLAYLHSEKKLTIVPSLTLKTAKTKEAIALVAKHGLTGKKVTFITENIEPELVLATRNLTGAKVVTAINLSILDVASGYVVMDEKVAEKFSLKKSTTVQKTVVKKETR